MTLIRRVELSFALTKDHCVLWRCRTLMKMCAAAEYGAALENFVLFDRF